MSIWKGDCCDIVEGEDYGTIVAYIVSKIRVRQPLKGIKCHDGTKDHWPRLLDVDGDRLREMT